MDCISRDRAVGGGYLWMLWRKWSFGRGNGALGCWVCGGRMVGGLEVGPGEEMGMAGMRDGTGVES